MLIIFSDIHNKLGSIYNTNYNHSYLYMPINKNKAHTYMNKLTVSKRCQY